MDDADDVVRVAAQFLASRGPIVIADLRELAEIAEANGDQLSATAWTDIADYAEKLLRRY